ncbi:uncharacterized protein DNG_10328 [Cephalotrichum gorgonifer]|uniref:Uncharacterized protein n=1 Tax=Cephalotrichum gorgonifer TaxID=2041049 RepID=A0AAE8T083_9PEZI|nr:uncharacterized protein DNG_10328 [Cephalotrichum gorgonifer]
MPQDLIQFIQSYLFQKEVLIILIIRL